MDGLWLYGCIGVCVCKCERSGDGMCHPREIQDKDFVALKHLNKCVVLSFVELSLSFRDVVIKNLRKREDRYR